MARIWRVAARPPSGQLVAADKVQAFAVVFPCSGNVDRQRRRQTMGVGVLAVFVGVQALALLAARGGGARRLRSALATVALDGADEAAVIERLGTPVALARDLDDIRIDWAERGPQGGWHVALLFADGRCLGISHQNFQPV
jgi:hypothetical protein